MIKAEHITKRFDEITAVDQVTAEIREGYVFGLIGTNGAGKSTFLRMASGVLKPDEGTVTIDGQPVWENPAVKSRFFYISDDQYFFPNSTPQEMMQFYRNLYPAFDEKRFAHLLESFGLKKDRKIHTFSKGMKKQLSVICGICAGTDYLFCDETFDGLDPVMRQTVKSLFANDMAERNLTPVIASHNLRELEDICDHIGLLHQGGVLLSRELQQMKSDLHKIQCVLPEEADAGLREEMDILNMTRRGKLLTLTVRGEESRILERLASMQPAYLESLPLSLEEIFIAETEVTGYDVKNILF